MSLTLDDLQIHAQTHDKQNSYWAHDARGIPLRRVCFECKHLLSQLYRPEVLGISGSYEDVVEEPIEPDDYSFG